MFNLCRIHYPGSQICNLNHYQDMLEHCSNTDTSPKSQKAHISFPPFYKLFSVDVDLGEKQQQVTTSEREGPVRVSVIAEHDSLGATALSQCFIKSSRSGGENWAFFLTITRVEVCPLLTTGPWGPWGCLSLVLTKVF